MTELEAIEVLAPSTPAAREKRRLVVEAAATVLAREGYAATSMKDVAQEAGIAQGLIHYYFASKDDLVMAIVKDSCDQMLAETVAAFEEATGGPLQRVWPALESARERTKHRPEMWRVFVELFPLSFNNPQLRAHFKELYDKITQTTLGMVQEINQQIPTPLPVDPQYFARVITATIDGIALQALADPALSVDDMYTAFGFVLIATISGSFAVAGLPVPGIEDLGPLLGGARVPPAGQR
ncbi:MAG: TetR/AcrR family transcriptional regulator [Candidatus Dormibacteraeota bacterium]|nr:TetR/AcrR family transcriptional regulator [Candidatus Dormibacteraeota bacterium]